ncbi:MAG: hypothetical protein GPJ54_20845 [Candidatus Heimdallarchaeota archaeon]|nr:hypothetical protein [Candidatus Heimdallarchaeota archaeon]
MVIEISEMKIEMRERNKVYQMANELWFAIVGSCLILFYPNFWERIFPLSSFKDYGILIVMIALPFVATYGWIKVIQTLRREKLAITIDRNGITIINQKNGSIQEYHPSAEVTKYQTCIVISKFPRSFIEINTKEEKIKIHWDKYWFATSIEELFLKFDNFMIKNYPNATKIK